MSFSNHAYVVLGATGGTGSALVAGLAQRGAKVLACGKDPAKVQAMAAEHAVEGFVLDATDPAQVAAAFVRAKEAFGGIAGAVNLVGSILLKPAHLTRDEEWMQTLALNLNTAFYLVREATKGMADGGSVVLVSTAAARVGLANHEAIAAAKGGVMGLTLSAATTYAPKNIRVNCVAPGLVDTPMSARIVGNEAAAKASKSMHALGRFGKPEDVAAMITFLLDPTNDWVTGQVIGVDGGLGTLKPMLR
ncbi:MAG: SDR family oxidoreductase [Bryobacterales bacterium]|jgi:NAD(P)-dependent dehydrogenase (short-subunit alcohol dehydrogenase family)|nr:SDR family oxidoreductase [Bryobacterales bacterium]